MVMYVSARWTCVTWSDAARKTFKDLTTKVNLAKVFQALFLLSFLFVPFVNLRKCVNEQQGDVTASG